MFDGFFINGAIANSFFFCLSGFLFLYSFFNLNEMDQHDYRKYLKKRFVRIFPVYWFYTALTLLFWLFCNYFFKYNFFKWIKADFSYFFRSVFCLPINFFKVDFPIIPPGWFLTAECFFYLIGALCFVFGLRKFLFFISFWIVNIIVWNVILKSAFFYAEMLFFNFFIGMACSLLIKRKVFNFICSIIAMIVGMVLLILTLFALTYKIIEHSVCVDLFIDMIFALIIYGVCGFESSCEKNTSFSLFNFLNGGYDIYLTHFILISILIPVFDKFIKINEILTFVIIFFITIAIGHLSYFIFNKKITLKFSEFLLKKG